MWPIYLIFKPLTREMCNDRHALKTILERVFQLCESGYQPHETPPPQRLAFSPIGRGLTHENRTASGRNETPIADFEEIRQCNKNTLSRILTRKSTEKQYSRACCTLPDTNDPGYFHLPQCHGLDNWQILNSITIYAVMRFSNVIKYPFPSDVTLRDPIDTIPRRHPNAYYVLVRNENEHTILKQSTPTPAWYVHRIP